MNLTKKQLKEIAKAEKKVAEVCDKHQEIVDEITGINYPKKTIEVGLNDKGVIINKKTGKPHFDEIKKLVEEKTSKDINIALNYADDFTSLKNQIKEQGFVIDNQFTENAEQIRFDLNSLNKIGILSDKQLYKCFKKLHKIICKKILQSVLKFGEKAIQIKTKKK